MTGATRVRAAKNKVRIIGGQWRSRTIVFTPRPDLRPTPDRVRETLFNWLGQDLTGKTCLDLFAGSGALGFEAASRGARHVLMIERDPQAVQALEANRARLAAEAVELKRADALEFLRNDESRYDIVFLDPPFTADHLPQVLDMLAPRLAPGARVHVEAPEAPALSAEWSVCRSGRAGAVIHQLLKRTDDDA